MAATKRLEGRRALQHATDKAILTTRAKVGSHEGLPRVVVVLLEVRRVGRGDGGGVIIGDGEGRHV
jgi:hypothetical protein